VQGVGPGTVLGGRYALQHRLSQDRALERWSAHDTTLLREVALTIVGSEHPNSAGVLDAARRAAGVEDTRLVRILDVGGQGVTSFVVEETMRGSESLATLLLQGPLPAEEARRIAGETATGLETARRRGLHHLRLTPHFILIGSDGAVRLSGVAVAMAIDGPDDQELDAVSASRRDAVCLVAVLYAALTSRWPLDELVSEVEAAPRVVDGVVAPSEIATGVPDDLDALCRRTLNQASGPLTPGDFARRIAPWPRERAPRGGIDPTVVLPLPGSGQGGAAAAASSTNSTAARLPSGGRAASAHQPEALRPAAAPLAGATIAGGQAAAPRTEAIRTSGQESVGAVPGGRTDQSVDLEPPMPLLHTWTALPPSRGQTKIVVLVVTIFVALAMYVGYRGLLGPVSGSSLSQPTPRRAPSVKAPPPVLPASTAPRPGKAASGPIAILSATGFDPEGDQEEGNSQAARVYDGDVSTSWSSELYATADFGNLKKGLGVLLDLGQPTEIHEVTVDLGKGPLDLTAYAATDPTLEGATVIGTAGGADGRIRLRATGSVPRAQYVIVWFTTLTADSGRFRASISEIALS